MKNLEFIFRFTKGKRHRLFVMFSATFVYVLIILINPLILQFTIDNIIGSEAISNPWSRFLASRLGGLDFIRQNLWVLAIVIVFMNMISGLALFFRGEASGQFAETYAQNLRNTVYDHLQKLPYAYHVKAKTGDLIQRCTSDIDQVTRFLNNQLRELSYAVIMLVIALSILFSINVQATWVTMIAFPFIFLFALIFFKKMQATFQKSDEAEAALSNVFQESLDAVRVVKAFNREHYELEKFEEKNHEYRDVTTHLIWLLGVYWSISDVVCFLQILTVLIYSTFAVRGGAMTLGDAVIFISYVSMVLWPVRNVGRILSDLGKVSVSISRLNEILVEVPEDLEQGDTPDIKGNIQFENVSFQYDDGDKPVLKGASFTIKAGETVAIMGPTGSGKSSLVHLLTRLYDPSSGAILIDGEDITKISRRHIREHVGIVLQEPYLFSKSILENIRVAVPDTAKEEVYEAALMASIHNDINSFDKGYQTMVGEKGVTLSGGQKQRVAIARMIINKQPIVIFDDSLSALDTQTDAAIRQALMNREKKATTLIITHRVNSAQSADKILVLQDGRIVQEGSHAQLMNEEGLYKRIALIQNNRLGGDQHGRNE